ncbi:MAG: CPBP family intramembrane glutamic endopeptidase [Bryobacterales bacterium]
MAAAKGESLAAGGLVAVLCMAMMAPPTAALPAFVVLAALALVVRRAGALLHLAVFAVLWAGVAAFAPASRVWPWNLLAPLLLYGLAYAVLRRSAPSFRAGRLARADWPWIFAIVLVSTVALALWVRFRSGPQHPLANIPKMPLWAYPLAAVVFAVGNAAIEELAFRGIVMGELDTVFGPGALPVVLQALVFGAAHFVRGFPNGWLGLAMATAYGLMLGALCRRTGGLLAPWAAHVAADLTIFALTAAVELNLR